MAFNYMDTRSFSIKSHYDVSSGTLSQLELNYGVHFPPSHNFPLKKTSPTHRINYSRYQIKTNQSSRVINKHLFKHSIIDAIPFVKYSYEKLNRSAEKFLPN